MTNYSIKDNLTYYFCDSMKNKYFTSSFTNSLDMIDHLE